MDKFTHCLLVKCSAEMLDCLLSTLIRQLQTTAGDSVKQAEAKTIIRRFVRLVEGECSIINFIYIYKS